MLTSAAAIATAVSTLIGVVWAVVAVVKKKAEAKKVATIESLNSQLKTHLTDEQREAIQNALNDITNSK